MFLAVATTITPSTVTMLFANGILLLTTETQVRHARKRRTGFRYSAVLEISIQRTRLSTEKSAKWIFNMHVTRSKAFTVDQIKVVDLTGFVVN